MENLSQELEFLDFGGLTESEKYLLQNVLADVSVDHSWKEEAQLPPVEVDQNAGGNVCSQDYSSCAAPEGGRVSHPPPGMEAVHTVPVTMAFTAGAPVYNPNMRLAPMQHYPQMINFVPIMSGAHIIGPSPNFFVNNMTANVNVNTGVPYLTQHLPQTAQPMHHYNKPQRRNSRYNKYPIKKETNMNGGHVNDGYQNVMYPHHSSYISQGPHCFPGNLVQAATGVPIMMQPTFIQHRNVPASLSTSEAPPQYPPVDVTQAPVSNAEVADDPTLNSVVETPTVTEEIVIQECAVKFVVAAIEVTKVEEIAAPDPAPASIEDASPPPASPRPASPRQTVSNLPPPTAEEPVDATSQKSWASLFKNAAVAVPVDKPTARVEPFSPSTEKKADSVAQVIAQVDDFNHQLAHHLSAYELVLTPLALLPRGLTNKSNWCYINATLQALIACPPFVHLMKSLSSFIQKRQGQSQTPIIDGVVEFVNQFEPVAIRSNGKERAAAKKEGLYFGNSFEPSSMYKMLSKIRSETFKVEGRQEDAEEFLSCLLNGLHDEMIEVVKSSEANCPAHQASPSTKQNPQASDDEDWQVIGPKNRGCVTRTTTYSKTPVSNLFLGLMRSALHHAGAQSTATLQPFFSLQLDIQSEKVNSVREALECLVSKEPLTGYVCSKSGLEVEASRQSTLEELPPILILHLKCFVYDKSGGCQKLLKRVEFTADLDLSKDFLSPAQKGKVKEKQRQYKLFAVVYHDGKEATKGHYVTEVKHDAALTWLRFDDSSVRTVADNQLFKYNLPRMPYLLLYRRADTFLPLTSVALQAGGSTSYGRKH